MLCWLAVPFELVYGVPLRGNNTCTVHELPCSDQCSANALFPVQRVHVMIHHTLCSARVRRA